jgi:hypothetical protein
MKTPINDLYIIISKVSKYPPNSLPDTAIKLKENIAPIIQYAALIVLDIQNPCKKKTQQKMLGYLEKFYF